MVAGHVLGVVSSERVIAMQNASLTNKTGLVRGVLVYQGVSKGGSTVHNIETH